MTAPSPASTWLVPSRSCHAGRVPSSRLSLQSSHVPPASSSSDLPAPPPPPSTAARLAVTQTAVPAQITHHCTLSDNLSPVYLVGTPLSAFHMLPPPPQGYIKPPALSSFVSSLSPSVFLSSFLYMPQQASPNRPRIDLRRALGRAASACVRSARAAPSPRGQLVYNRFVNAFNTADTPFMALSTHPAICCAGMSALLGPGIGSG